MQPAGGGFKGARCPLPAYLWPACSATGSLDDFAKTGVVIAGVVAGVRRPGLAATHNAPGSPVARSWCSDGVLTVVTPLVGGQQPLAIAKNRSVLVIRKGPSFMNQRVGCAPLGRQLGQCNGGNGAGGGRGVPGMPRNRGQHERNTQNTQKPCFARPGGYSLQHQRTFHTTYAIRGRAVAHPLKTHFIRPCLHKSSVQKPTG